MASRTPLMAGNWKMNLTHPEAVALVQKLAWILADKKHDYGRVEVVVVPPFTDLRSVQTLVDGDRLSVKYAAQDVSTHDSGAYTGEISAAMLAEFGCCHVIVGHSERRALHGESDALVAQKAAAALKHGLVPILCVGETLAEREAGQTEAVVGRQLGAAIELLDKRIDGVVIAYEPVWAIGTGKTASPAEAQAVHAFLRKTLAAAGAASGSLRILYGGSVKADNAAQLFAESDIDGGLIGGASLKAADFIAICRAAR